MLMSAVLVFVIKEETEGWHGGGVCPLLLIREKRAQAPAAAAAAAAAAVASCFRVAIEDIKGTGGDGGIYHAGADISSTALKGITLDAGLTRWGRDAP